MHPFPTEEYTVGRWGQHDHLNAGPALKYCGSGVNLSAIFVSYRRNDSQGEAGRLFDDLVGHFGEQKVFMDVAGIDAGRDFRKAIEESVAKCGVLLVVMGSGWVTAKNEAGVRRLDDPADFVRAEVASALRRDIPVIPVLVHGAVMPRAEDLPADLKDLAYRNCVELTHARWKSDVQLLIEPLRRLIASSGQVQSRPAQGESNVAKQTPPSQAASPPANSNPVTTSRFDPATLQRIRRELALCIGPIADVGVSRAVRTSNSIEELLAKVAEEIESPQRRDEFLRKMGALPRSSIAAPATPLPASSRPQYTPVPVDEIDAEPSNSAPAARSAVPSKRFGLLIVVAVGVALLGFALVKLVQGPAGARSSTPHESPPQPSQPEPAPEKSRAPEASSLPGSTTSNATPSVASAVNKRVSLSPDISQNLLLKKVVPTYPPLATKARIHGEVVLDVDISKEGTVESLRAVSGHPMLIPAAIDAVKNWRYKPYLVDGKPVPVQTQVTVNFALKTG